MNPNSHIPEGGRSERAASAVNQATQHMGGRFGKPFYGEGMHEGNTTPTQSPTMTKPAMGATPPMQANPTQSPGKGASAITRKGKP